MAVAPLENEKILITGVTGAIARPVARALAEKNEVWGAARFTNPALRKEIESYGVRIAEVDFEKNDYEAIPEDITMVLHYAYTRRPSGEFQDAIQVNAIAAGHVMQRCQHAKAALIVSAATLYSAQEDPFHAYHEQDDIGYARAPWGPSSPVSKVTLETIARFSAQVFDLPTTIVRPSGPYGTDSDIASVVVDAVLAEKPVFAFHDPQPYSVIHIDDMIEQIPALLAAATVPATILNWASDEIVTTQQMAAQAGIHLGKPATVQIMQADGVAKGAVIDTTRIRKVVGPCPRKFEEEFARICRARIASA
jgi:nucleoside-diphosphate-sugar epimerase